MNLIHDLTEILKDKEYGTIEPDKIIKIENYLQLHNKTENELFEIRNNVADTFYSAMEKLKVYTDEKHFNLIDKDKFWLLEDVMSASVMVIDSRLYEM